jgi:hypothetical protein
MKPGSRYDGSGGDLWNPENTATGNFMIDGKLLFP